MQLYVSLTSPFARKARVAVIEKGLSAHVEEMVVDPWTDPQALIAVNPLSQVPTLVTDDDLPISNSDTILDHLERRFPTPPLWPQQPLAQARALSLAALAQGMLECTVHTVLENRRPPEQRSREMLERRLTAIRRTLTTLASRFDASRGRFEVDGIGIACALGYLDLRQPGLDWRSLHPVLAEWYAWAATRPSLQQTEPPA